MSHNPIFIKSLFFLAVPALLASCAGQAAGDVSQAMAVKTAAACRHTAGRNVAYQFITRPYSESELSFRVGGPLSDFDIVPGRYFSEGSVLMELDTRDFEIEYGRTEALYSQALSEYGRCSTLYARNSISASVFDKAAADLAVAESNFRTASNNLRDTKVYAPYDGYVQQVYAEPYDEVRPGQRVLSFIRISRLKAQAYVSEEVAARLFACGMKDMGMFVLRFDNMPSETFCPVSAELSRTTVDNNMSYLLTLVIDNAGGTLPGGMGGTLSISLPQQDGSEDLLCIPQPALCHNREDGDYVWSISSSRAVKKKVTLEGVGSGSAFISAGLAEGDTVAVTGTNLLYEGALVRQ